MMTRHGRLAATPALASLAGFVFLALAQGATAQEEKPQGQRVNVKNAQPIKLEKAATAPKQDDEVMGPPQPPPRRPGRFPQPREVRRQPVAAPTKKSRGVPEPTVVLGPGEVPGIKFDTPTYDFGRIRGGPDVIHDYWFTNTGTGPLEILKVSPG
ncbi:MAG: DUF1573 domain-containing protein [Phycisphaerae bacterium]|nr:DUF1573 domain-containing protein [Phycisphaerae bacterium]